MSKISTVRQEKVGDIAEEIEWEFEPQENSAEDGEYTNENLKAMLNYYIEEKEHYVVTGAVISCDQMSDKLVYIKSKGNRIEITSEMGKKTFWATAGDPERFECYEAHAEGGWSRKLYAVHATDQTAVGRTYATVRDCICQRDRKEGKGKEAQSIISLGNCKLMEETDAEEIGKRKEEAYRYGTCYCLIKPDEKWVNPFCMESLVGECHVEDRPKTNIPQVDLVGPSFPEIICRTVPHHTTMKWSTDNGLEEGITMLSTLLCTRGGIVTIEKSGQVVKNNYEVFALACTPSGSHAGALTDEQQKSNAHYVYNFLRRKGWSVEAICGLLGNMSEECGINPGAWQVWEDTETYGYGIAQWTPAKGYLNYADLKPNEANELAETDPQALMDNQLEFLMLTLESDKKDKINRWMTKGVQVYYDKVPLSDGVSGAIEYRDFYQSKRSPKDLALIFHACYERSRNGPEVLGNRARAAGEWYTYFTGIIMD